MTANRSIHWRLCTNWETAPQRMRQKPLISVAVLLSQENTDLCCRAAELGEYRAYCDIGGDYHEGIIVEKDESKASAFYEIAAKKGDIISRHNLAYCEYNRGNHALAVRHFKISAEAGYQASLDELKEHLQSGNGLLESNEFAGILRKCLAAQAEMKTDQREAYEKFMKEI